MRTRTWCCFAAVVITAIACLALFSDRSLQSATPEDEKAIRKAADDYAAAFNKADTEALSKFWAADAEHIDDEGKSTKGKAAIGDLFKKSFAENKGTQIRIATTTLRFFNDVAWQEGTISLTQPDGEEEKSPFTAVWTRKDGQWLLAMVRDHPVGPTEEEGPPVALKELGWLVGDWSHENKGVKTTLNVKWMKGERFLVCNMQVTDQGEETLSLIQVIGWDPTGEQLHSWVFDTRGGFGEGYWTAKGSTWRAEVAGVTADGRNASGTNIWRKTDKDAFTFEGVDRDVDGTALPDVSIAYKRVGVSK